MNPTTMRQFGAEIYVANLIGLSMLRELGPLLTAIILAGRSGSAFAAELGTMNSARWYRLNYHDYQEMLLAPHAGMGCLRQE